MLRINVAVLSLFLMLYSAIGASVTPLLIEEYSTHIEGREMWLNVRVRNVDVQDLRGFNVSTRCVTVTGEEIDFWVRFSSITSNFSPQADTGRMTVNTTVYLPAGLPSREHIETKARFKLPTKIVLKRCGEVTLRGFF